MKHLKKRNGVIVVKNNRHIVGKGTMMKIQRHALSLDKSMNEPIHHHHITGAAISHIATYDHSHYDINLERLKHTLSNLNLNSVTRNAKNYVKF